MERDDLTEIELIDLDSADDGFQDAVPENASRRDWWLPAILLVVVAGFVGWSVLSDSDAADTADPDEETPERLDAVRVAQSVPPALLVAELYFADPTAEGLRDLFEVLGGFSGLELGTAEGAFDLVRFDPNDGDRLLASLRSSYGEAENQQHNEIWELTEDGDVDQIVWEPTTAHDFVHYNVDGTATMWVHGGGDGFAPRTAVVLDEGFSETAFTEPIYASRFTSAGGTVFALTGNGDYYTTEDGYVDLVADDGLQSRILADGALYSWIDNPTPGILVAYPTQAGGVTAVWNVATLSSLSAHPLSRRAYQRAAISGDGTVALGATFDGRLEAINLTNGQHIATFGEVDVSGVDQPLSLNLDGTMAMTVESSGRLTIWWVGADTPITSIDADQAQPRWVSSAYAPTSASALSPDSRRVVLRTSASTESPATWTIVDTDPASWIRRACGLAGRGLTGPEAEALGLPADERAC